MDEQIQACVALVIAAADEEGNIFAADFEFEGGEGSSGGVAFDFAADNVVVAAAFNFQFGDRLTGCGAFAERRPSRLPVSVPVAGEVCDWQIVCAASGDKEPGRLPITMRVKRNTKNTDELFSFCEAAEYPGS